MNEQEKARELVEIFRPFVDIYELSSNHEQISDVGSTKLETENAKQCALICVGEILAEYDTKILSGRPSHLEACKAYWQNVKSEIEKL